LAADHALTSLNLHENYALSAGAAAVCDALRLPQGPAPRAPWGVGVGDGGANIPPRVSHPLIVEREDVSIPGCGTASPGHMALGSGPGPGPNTTLLALARGLPSMPPECLDTGGGPGQPKSGRWGEVPVAQGGGLNRSLVQKAARNAPME